jgi:hypothetical protein
VGTSLILRRLKMESRTTFRRLCQDDGQTGSYRSCAGLVPQTRMCVRIWRGVQSCRGKITWTRSPACRRSVLVAAIWWSSSTARFGRFTSKWRCQRGCRMLADSQGTSPVLYGGDLKPELSGLSAEPKLGAS